MGVYLNIDNKTVFDLFEEVIKFNALPPNRRHSDPIVQVALDRPRWMHMLALKQINYKGHGNDLVMDSPTAVYATYRNLSVYFNGTEDGKGSIMDLIDFIQRNTITETRTPTAMDYVVQATPADRRIDPGLVRVSAGRPPREAVNNTLGYWGNTTNGAFTDEAF